MTIEWVLGCKPHPVHVSHYDSAGLKEGGFGVADLVCGAVFSNDFLGPGEDRLVTRPRGGVLTTATVRDATKWDTIVTELGLPDLTRHGLRHTGATWFADPGIPLHVLQKILGHQSLETTRGYLHPDHRHLAAAAAQANAFLTGWSPTKEAPEKAPRRDGPAR